MPIATFAQTTAPILRPDPWGRSPQPEDAGVGPPTAATPGRRAGLPEQRGRRTPETILSRSAPRRRILAQLTETPGIHLRALQRHLDLEMSVLVHHLDVLRREGHAASHSFGYYKAYYPSAGVDHRDWALLFLLRQEQAGRILRLLDALHTADTTRIAAALGVGLATCSYHLKRLHRAGILVRVPARTHVLWSLQEPDHVARLVRRDSGAPLAITAPGIGAHPTLVAVL